MHQDLNLTTDDVQMDVINSSGMNGRVDAFVTDGNCDRLFSASYNGTVTSPLCTIYIGPVSTGMASQRKAMRPGKYRVFEQAYTTNSEAVQFLMEVGLWSEACHWNPVAP